MREGEEKYPGDWRVGKEKKWNKILVSCDH
jgi:hypothetical protein